MKFPRIAWILLALIVVLALSACGPTEYPYGDYTCWEQQDELQYEELGCLDEEPARVGDNWDWDGTSREASWLGVGCEFDTETCPGQYECQLGTGTFTRMCSIPGVDASSSAVLPIDPTVPGTSYMYNTPWETDTSYIFACSIFSIDSWGTRQIDLANFPGCAGWNPDELAVACWTAETQGWTARDVSMSAASGETFSVTFSQHGTCGLFTR